MSNLRGSALRAVVEDLFSVVKDRSTKSELTFVCPQPGCGDNSGNRSVNLDSGKTNCFRCNKGGDFVAWAKFLGYAVDDTGVLNAVPFEELNFNPDVDVRDRLPVVVDIKLPHGFCYCHARPKSVYTDLIREMAEAKRLTIEDLMEAKVGFTKLDPKWEPYAIFPVFEYDHVVYFQGRTYVDVPGESTKLFPTRREAPFGAKYWIYNIDELRTSKAPVAIVVESILNVISLRRYMLDNQLTGAVPVCVFKHYMSKPQARKVMQLAHVKEICLLYDHDATKSSWEKSPLIANHTRVTVAEMPPGPGGEKNDANDDPAAAWAAFERRKVSDAGNALITKVSGNFSDYAPMNASFSVRQPPIDPLIDIGL